MWGWAAPVRWLLCGAAAWVLVLANPAVAQTQGVVKLPAADPASAAEASAAPAGPKVGPFTVGASLSAGEIFSDNVFVTKNDKRSDWIALVSPGLSASLGDQRNRLDLSAGADLGRYATYTSENYNDGFVAADGRLRLGKSTSLFGGGRYDWLHEPRESPDVSFGSEPARYRAGDYYAGVLQSFSKGVLRIGGAANTFAFDNVPSASGFISNVDRNRTEYQVGARYSYRLGKTLQPFVQGYFDSRDYLHPLDDYGFRRSSSGYRVAVGLTANPSKALSGEVYAGALGQSYDDPRFARLIRPDFGARLRWTPPGGPSLSAFVDRTLEETTLSGSAGYVRTAVGGAVEQVIKPDLIAIGHFYYSQNSYLDADRVDFVTDAGLGLKYFFAPRLFVAADYAYLHRISNAPGWDFDENRFSIRLGMQLVPRYRPGQGVFTSASTRAPGGFYLGLLAGDGLLTTAVDGVREKTGRLTADFGDDGWQGDLVLGYGAMLGRAYLGLEADASLGSQNWLHAGQGGTRTFSARKLGAYELAARLGYQLPGRALLYGRFGVIGEAVATRFGPAAAPQRQDNFLRGLGIGGGVEFPVSGGLWARMEYDRAAYKDYDVVWGSGPDNYANAENLMKFGLVYHFGASADAAPAPTLKPSGFYAGLQGGFGSLVSANAGPRSPPKTLDAQRAGEGGTGGVFGGYGVTAGHFYLAAEGEAEASNTDWNIERDPDGRLYSVAKAYSLGASALAGFRLAGGAIVYGRIGAVATHFDNNYADEGGGNRVTPGVTRWGLRSGGGVMLPLGRRTFLRMDYSWTRYPSYDVNYVTGQDSFRNAESLMRLGVGFRF